MSVDDRRKRWDALLDRLPSDRDLIGAEVGVWGGKTAYQVLRARPRCSMYLVDRWAPAPEGDSYLTSGSTMALQPKDVYKKKYLECVGKVRFAGRRAIFLVGDSVVMADRVGAGTLDFVFVDGDHSYEGCLRDIRAWLPKVRLGGLIGGHDYAHPDQGEVKRAVDEWFGADGIELDSNRTWWVRL